MRGEGWRALSELFDVDQMFAQGVAPEVEPANAFGVMRISTSVGRDASKYMIALEGLGRGPRQRCHSTICLHFQN